MTIGNAVKSMWKSITSHGLESAGKNLPDSRLRKQNYVSLVVVAYNIPRELPRTLLSLSSSYQRDVTVDDYEVIVVDNGSTPPVDAAVVAGFGSNAAVRSSKRTGGRPGSADSMSQDRTHHGPVPVRSHSKRPLRSRCLARSASDRGDATYS